MDQDGNIAFGFSNAGSKFDPGILFTGRLSTDAVNTMETIESAIAGTGYQSPSDFESGRPLDHGRRSVGRLHLLVQQRILHRCQHEHRPVVHQSPRLQIYFLPVTNLAGYYPCSCGIISSRELIPHKTIVSKTFF